MMNYADYIFLTEMITSPVTLPASSGTLIDQEIDFRAEHLDEGNLRTKVRDKFRAKPHLKYAYHVIYIQANKNLVWIMRTEVYFFSDKESLLKLVKEKEEITYDKMNKEIISKNDFIFINNE
jgi:hypothetical protein